MKLTLTLTLIVFVTVFDVGSSTTESLPETYYEFEGREDTGRATHATGACPQTSYFFPNIQTTTNYIRVTKPIPDLHEFTVCGIFKRFTNGVDWWVSYATMPGTTNNHNEFMIRHDSNQMEIAMNMKWVREDLKLSANKEYHICVTSFSSTGTSYVFLDGDLREIVHTKSGTINGSGTFILGQDQDVIGGKFDANQSFQGTMRNFMLWRRALEPKEIMKMYQDQCLCPQDYLFTLERKNIEISGGVAAVWPPKC